MVSDIRGFESATNFSQIILWREGVVVRIFCGGGEVGTQFVEDVDGEEYDGECEGVASRGDYCCEYEQYDDGMTAVFFEKLTVQYAHIAQ